MRPGRPGRSGPVAIEGFQGGSAELHAPRTLLDPPISHGRRFTQQNQLFVETEECPSRPSLEAKGCPEGGDRQRQGRDERLALRASIAEGRRLAYSPRSFPLPLE